MYPPNQPPSDEPGQEPQFGPPPSAPPPPVYGEAPPLYQPPGYQPPPQAQGTNGFAIAALVFGLLGGCLALIFGPIALSQIKKTGQQGRGMAIAGMVAFGVWLVIGVLIGVTAALSAKDTVTTSSGISPVTVPTASMPSLDYSTTSAASGSRSVSVTNLHVGECVDGIQNDQSNSRVTVTDCNNPHDAEVMYTYRMTDSAFPGTDESEREAQTTCKSQLEGMIRTSPMADRLAFLYLYPNSQESFSEDKGVICLVADKGDNKLTGKVNP